MIFNKKVCPNNLTIIHRQEERFFIGYYECRSTKELSSFLIEKLWIIDDLTQQMMLFSE
jgi:hypothetical protein